MAAITERIRREAESVRSLRIAAYEVVVHSSGAARLINANYSAAQLRKLERFLKPVLAISLTERGFVKAAERMFKGGVDPTHYDAIWIRDSLWAYLGLRCYPERYADAKRVLKGMLDYVSTPPQLRRLRNLRTVHIRFDGKSPEYHDVRIGAVPQPWNHNQNDAIGLLLDLALRAIEDGFLHPDELTPANWQALALIPAFFIRTRFHEREDAGCWEEIERVNTSSVGLVTSGLETLCRMSHSAESAGASSLKRMRQAVSALGLYRFHSAEILRRQIEMGYATIRKQLKAGGESPCYSFQDPRYRCEDAALLNLIFPARLSQLTAEEKTRILHLVKSLAGRIGIRRYRGDSYQCGNYWLTGRRETNISSATDSTRSFNEFVARGRGFVPDTEAQWFFDSWYSVAAAEVYRQSGAKRLVAEQVGFFNRAVGQITSEIGAIGADGKEVHALALPESYNTVFVGGAQYLVPSPIIPLNWAKASLALALEHMKST